MFEHKGIHANSNKSVKSTRRTSFWKSREQQAQNHKRRKGNAPEGHVTPIHSRSAQTSVSRKEPVILKTEVANDPHPCVQTIYVAEIITGLLGEQLFHTATATSYKYL